MSLLIHHFQVQKCTTERLAMVHNGRILYNWCMIIFLIFTLSITMVKGSVKYSSTRLVESEIWLEFFQESGKLPRKKRDTCDRSSVRVRATGKGNLFISKFPREFLRKKKFSYLSSRKLIIFRCKNVLPILLVICSISTNTVHWCMIIFLYRWIITFLSGAVSTGEYLTTRLSGTWIRNWIECL